MGYRSSRHLRWTHLTSSRLSKTFSQVPTLFTLRHTRVDIHGPQTCTALYPTRRSSKMRTRLSRQVNPSPSLQAWMVLAGLSRRDVAERRVRWITILSPLILYDRPPSLLSARVLFVYLFFSCYIVVTSGIGCMPMPAIFVCITVYQTPP
jgi:hypothetical protein